MRASNRWISFAFLVGLAACSATTEPQDVRAKAAVRPTQPFRDEHVQIQQHLAHIHAWVGELEGLAPEAQRERMRQVVAFLEDHIVSHAQWEERALYPAVDSRALSGDHPFTASMRYEHGIVGRWIAEMERFAAAEPPDVRAFSRRADNLLGLIWAHFEEEEEVLLPILDQSMTPEEFQREILERADHPSG